MVFPIPYGTSSLSLGVLHVSYGQYTFPLSEMLSYLPVCGASSRSFCGFEINHYLTQAFSDLPSYYLAMSYFSFTQSPIVCLVCVSTFPTFAYTLRIEAPRRGVPTDVNPRNLLPVSGIHVVIIKGLLNE